MLAQHLSWQIIRKLAILNARARRCQSSTIVSTLGESQALVEQESMPKTITNCFSSQGDTKDTVLLIFYFARGIRLVPCMHRQLTMWIRHGYLVVLCVIGSVGHRWIIWQMEGRSTTREWLGYGIGMCMDTLKEYVIASTMHLLDSVWILIHRIMI